jgi:hypothetical protein
MHIVYHIMMSVRYWYKVLKINNIVDFIMFDSWEFKDILSNLCLYFFGIMSENGS